MTIKRRRYTEPQIVFALQQAEAGTPVAEVCRKMGVVEATFHRWKKRYGGLGVSGVRQLSGPTGDIVAWGCCYAGRAGWSIISWFSDCTGKRGWGSAANAPGGG